MGGGGDDEHAALSGEVGTTGNDSTDIGMSLILVDDEVLSTDEHTAGAIATAGDIDKEVGAIIDGLGPLAGDVIEPEIQLIEG